MARQVLTVAGFVVGAYFGQPALGMAIGSAIGNAVDPEVIKGPKLGEAGLQTSAEGVYRPIVLGTGPVKGNVIHRGNRQVRTQRTSQGKGSGPVSENDRVYWTFAIRLCEAPVGGIGGVTRIWQDEKLVYDVTPGSAIVAESGQFAERFRLYLGDEDQLPDPDLEAFMGVGNVNSYHGTAYVVFPNFDLTDFGERIPDFRFEVSNQPAVHSYGFLLHMDEKFSNPGDHIRDEVDPGRWSPGGPLVSSPVVFGPHALQIHEEAHCPITTTDFASIIGTQDFCISGWIYRDSAGDSGRVYDTILGHWYAIGTRSFQFYAWRVDDENLAVALSNDGTAIVDIAGNIPVPKDEYVYVAVTRSGGVVRLWQQISPTECVEVGSGSFPYELHSNAGQVPGENWVIGGFDQAPFQNIMYGQIEELVLIIGSPVYTETFAPPAAPWPNPATAAGSSIELGQIVEFLHQRAGHTADDYDVGELDDEVEGLVLAEGYTSADAIRTLTPIYNFDASEYDGGDGYRVHYPKRGKPVVLTIDEDDIVDAPDKTVREDPLEMPRKVHLHYQNRTIGYAPAKATATRNSPDVLVVGERSIQIPVTFSDVNKPARIVDRIKNVMIAEAAGEEEFTVGDHLIELVPGDCIGVSLRGQVRRMRIGQEMISPGEIGWKLIPDRQSAYTSNVTGVPVPTPTPPRPSIPGQTAYEFMDIAALHDGQDRLIWNEAASGQSPAWYGAQTQRKAGAAVEFDNTSLFTQKTIMGDLLDPISAASEHYPDRTNVVRVRLYTDDAIEALTEQQFLSELGSFALKNADGSWELLQYRDVEDEGDGVFALSHLTRGRINSGTSAHLAGARFVLLDGVQAADAGSAWLNTDITTRAISRGTSSDGVPQYTNTFVGRSQIEFPVAHVLLDRVADTITVRAVPRHRFGTELNPVASINWRGYRMTATDGTSSLTVDTTSATHSFDVTGMASPITVTVAQINRYTGAGPARSEQIA